MFYHRRMAIGTTSAARSRLADVRALRDRLERMQGTRMDSPALPTHPLLADLLPGGGLRPGAVYAVASTPSLLLALLAGPSQAGSWVAAIGMPTLGVEAAALAGITLERLVLVPAPGPRWLSIASAVAEVLPVVAVRPHGAVRDAEVSRLAARLRDRGAVLLVDGDWPQADAVLEVDEPRWKGVGTGHGYLSAREVTVTVHSRRSPVPRRARMLLPGPEGRLAEAAPGLRPALLDEAPAPARLSDYREAG